MRPVIALDLSLLAVPSSAKTSAEAEEILARLNIWARAAEVQNCVLFAISSDAIGSLQAANCFPGEHNIRALLEMFELEHVFSPKDINARLFSLVQRAERLVDVLGIEVLTTENANAVNVDISGSPDCAITAAMHCLLASICFARRPEMVRAILGFPVVSLSVSFSGDVSRIERLDDGTIDINPSEHIRCDVRIVHTPAEFLASLNPTELWREADDEIQLHMAISLEAERLSRAGSETLPSDRCSTFCIGADFVVSLRGNLAFGDGAFSGVVRQRCAQIILGSGGAEVREFGTKRAADGAESYRVHIGKRHEALRLMIWKRSDGTIEFANIGPKKQKHINEGNCSERLVSFFNWRA